MEDSKLKESRTFPIVIVGHVDHGKSTLIGRLLYSTESLSAEKVREVENALEKSDKQFEFAHLVDYLEEERLNEMTIDTSQVFFKTKKRRYVIIDAPGHKEFIKNMITGSSQAQAALLIVDVTKGVEEQTKRHVYLLKLLGLTSVCVLINKMDEVDYSQQEFNEVKDSVQSLFKRMETNLLSVIPISAYKGDNIVSSSKRMDWFKESTVVETIDSLSFIGDETKPLRFPVQDVYKDNGNKFIVGRVEAGRVQVGQLINVLPSNFETRITSINKYLEKDVKQAVSGECIGLSIEQSLDIKRGQVLVEKNSTSFPVLKKSVNANIFWMVEETGVLNAPLVFKCATQEIPCHIMAINKIYDPAFENVEKENENINLAEVAQVEIGLESPALIDKFSEFAELGRFVLERNGQPVAGGIIL